MELAVFGIGIAVLYVVSAVLFFHRGGGEGFLGGLNFKVFVARRYLLVKEPKVTTRTKWAIAICLLVRVGVLFLYLAGAPAHDWHDPLWSIELAAELVLMVVVVGGVLVYSRPALWTFISGVVLGAAGFGASVGITRFPQLLHDWTPDHIHTLAIVILIAVIAGVVLAGLALFFGVLRAYFTFFTTVPIGGVWIGTGALVCVLSVMSGFESDLRDKILGSNAHILVTREDGEITEWRAVKNQIDHIPGVVASTPYAESEVVIAANNNGANVIIKGIDPKTIGNVTKLVQDLEDKDAMTRLDPLVEDRHDLHVEQRPPPAKLVDPAPADMPSSADPIDYSQPGSDTTPGSAAPSMPPIIPPLPSDDAPPPAPVHPAPVIDPAPPGLVSSDEPPIDYSAPGSGSNDAIDLPVHVPIDAAFDAPSMSKRTQSLPGVLVGRELVKQTHLYQGEEVRVVSPLSDPSNPDATGTPIPFNRDYRVAGVFYTGMYEYDLKHIYVTLDSLQEFLDRGDTIDGIEVRITDPDDTDQLVPRIAKALGPQYLVQDWKELNNSLFSALKLEKVAMFMVLGIVILVASFSIVGNLIMVVVEKGREIALLKTLGASDAGVMQLFAIQGLLIGLIGTTLGVLTGLAACYVGKNNIPLNPDVYYIDRMPVHVDASSVIVTFMAGVVISIAATFYPALLAARIRPAAGMRH